MSETRSDDPAPPVESYDAEADEAQPGAPDHAEGEQRGEADTGYVADVPFRSGVRHAQMPVVLATAAAWNGFVPPDPAESFTYVDLGCGDGTPITTAAATYPNATFIGVDFNAEHIESARELADVAGATNITLHHSGFHDLAGLDLPVVDFAAMHGIYSWLTAEEIGHVHRFLRTHLRAGGLFYAEYMSLPGKIAVQPVWDYVKSLVPAEGREPRARAAEAMELLRGMVRYRAGYLNANPPALRAARAYLQGERERQLDHFAHNVLAEGWRPRYADEMMVELGEVGLSYAGRTTFRLNDLRTCLGPAQRSLIERRELDVGQRESFKDFLRNEQTRCDVFIKDTAPDHAGARDFLLAHQPCVLLPAARAAERYVRVVPGHRVPLTSRAHEALFAHFDGAGGRLAECDAMAGVSAANREGLLKELLAGEQLVPARTTAHPVPEGYRGLPVQMVDGLNARLLAEARDNLTPCRFVSPVTGGVAVRLTPMETQLLAARLEAGPDEAVAAAQRTAEQDTRQINVVGEGMQRLDQVDEAEFERAAKSLQGRKLYNLLRLGIATVAGASDAG